MAEPKSAYLQWIAEHVGIDPHGQCKQVTERMAAAFPELRRVRGHYVCPVDGPQPHWWMVTPDGIILDPTKAQFASQSQGVYEPHEGPEPTGTCLNCGTFVFDGTSFCNSDCTKEFTSYVQGEVE
jgi:hypothetical protein